MIMSWQNTDEARKLRRQAAILRRDRVTREALQRGIADAERLAREAAVLDIADTETEREGGDEPEVPSTSGAADTGYVVASDASSGRNSPAPLEDPVVVVQHRAHRQAHAWGSMGTDLMVRLIGQAGASRPGNEGTARWPSLHSACRRMRAPYSLG